MGIEKHVEKLKSTDKTRLTRVRNIRRDVSADESLDAVERAVLYATGSVKELERFQVLTELIGSDCIGQPLVKIEKLDQKGTVLEGKAGLIAGPLAVGSAWSSTSDPSRGFGEVSLTVPVSPVAEIVWSPSSSGRFLSGSQCREHSITVARISFNERNNRSLDPSNDYSIDEGRALVVGYSAVYRSEHLAGNMARMLTHLGEELTEGLRIAVDTSE